MNLISILEKNLPSEIWQLVIQVGQVAGQRGWKAFLVGGVVRDILLGRKSLDLDLVIEGDAFELAQCLATEGLVLHPRFRTAKVRWKEWTLDLATARSEFYPYPGALPIVKPATIKEDLFRRDFTINAMAVHLSPPYLGELLDPFNGKGDLERGLIRILHPNSFRDDATRILRALRYEQRFDFHLEEETEQLLIRDIIMLDTISGDRLRHELELILKEEKPEKVLKRAEGLGVLKHLSPSLKIDHWLEEKMSSAPSIPLRFCLLFYTLPQEEIEGFIRRLNFPKALALSLRQTLELKEKLPLLSQPLSPSQIYDLLKDFSLNSILANALASPPEIAQKLELFLNRLRFVKPHLKGEDLKELGVAEGWQMGMVLKRLLQARLDGEIKTKQEEEAFVRRFLASLPPLTG